MGKWQKVRFGDILTERKVESIAPRADSRIRVLLNAKGVIKRPIKKETKGATKYFIRKKGQFIYGKQNIHKGAFGIVPDELDGFESTSDLPAFDVDANCLPLWIDYYLKQGNFYLSLVSIARGAATKRVQPKELLEIEIPLPSIEEQETIISHFKSIETEDRELKQELTHQQTLLKKLRQSILQEAIEGKLTADWRQENPDVEPASELLARIQAEKEQLIKDKKIKNQKPLPPISEDEKPFELPERWEWCRLGNISINSLGKMLDAQKNKGELKPYLRNLNVQWYEVDITDLKQMPFETHETEKYSVKNGDIVICEGGYPGQAAIWKLDHQIMFQKALHRVRFISSCFPSKLFVHLLWLWDANGEIKRHCTGAGIQHLTGKSLNKMLIPLPPLTEQKAIVAKIEKLFALCDQLETRITSNQNHAEQLMQAVLKEAFTQNNEPQRATAHA